jgi:hypothetical protein
MIYALSAITAAKLASEKNLTPVDAWAKAVVKEFPNSISSQLKGCPKNAFLGLCEDGLIKGIPRGKYSRSVLNKHYAVTAIEFLREWKNSKLSPLDLWPAVLKKLDEHSKKQHNSQMNVVLALWDADLLNMNR